MRSSDGPALRAQLEQARDRAHRLIDLGRRTRAAWRDARGFHAEGIAARARNYRTRAPAQTPSPASSSTASDRVGGDGELWHDDGDRIDAVRALHRGFTAFCSDAAPRMTTAAPPSLRQWWSAEVVPMVETWCAFAEGQEMWSKRTATEWSTYEDWLDKLRDLRSSARAHGWVLHSPEPPDLPKTVHQRAQEGRGSSQEAWWTIGRVAVYTTLGALGILTLW